MKLLQNQHRSNLGIILLLMAAAGASPAADVEFFGVIKMQRFDQRDATAPALIEETGMEEEPAFVFNTFVDLTSSNAVTGGTLTLPGGASRPLTLEDGGFTRDFFDGAWLKPELDKVYSNGTYTLSLQTQNDGNKNIPLTFPASDAYPNPPRLSNFAAAQIVNAAANFTLQWDAFAGGLTTDFIQLEILDPLTDAAVFETSGPGEPGSLNGTSTSVLLPAGTLTPGRTYHGRIFFARIVDFDDTTYGGGVTGVAAFLVETTFPLQTSGGTDNQQPQLQSASPSPMQVNVKGSAVVAFTFSERMNTTLPPGTSVVWSGNISAGQMTHAWSSDGRTLFCIYAPGLPINSTISWQLNPGGSPENLRDLAGNKLPPQSGSFYTGNQSGAGERDVDFLALVKARVFLQAGNTAEPAQLHLFSLTSDLNALNSVTNGLVTLPNARTVTPELDLGDVFDFESAYASQAQLDSFFPNGGYQVRFDTVRDGSRLFNFTLNGDAYPNAPQIVNYATTQTVNPSNAFTLSWNAFTTGTASDFIRLEIEADDEYGSEVFETPNFNEPGALRGTNSSVIIPAGTFAPGRTYTGELLFVKVSQVDLATYPGVVAASGYLSITGFELRTLGEPIRPTLRIGPNGSNIRVTVTGERNRNYTIESADAVVGGLMQWTTRFTGMANSNVNGFTASFDFDDGPAAPGSMRFYRAREASGFGGGGNP